MALLIPAAIVGAGLATLGTQSANGAGLPGLPGLPVLSSIVLSPTVASIAQGQTQQFTAMGLLSDGTLQAITNGLTWSTSSPGTASVSPTGLANGLSAGAESITATAPGGLLGLLSPLTGKATLTVFPLLESILLSPTVASLAQGQTQQFSATGIFSDGTVQAITNDLNWSSASGTLASVSNTGLATGLLPGVDTVSATAPAGLLTGPLAGLLSPLTSAASLTVLSGSAPPTIPALTMTPTTGKKRTVVTALGSNFSPGQSVIVTYLSGLRARNRASSVLCATTVASTGAFSCTGVIPHGMRSGRIGKHTVTALVSGVQTGTTIFDLLKGTVPTL